ncbi:MAG: PEP-utilizing enzyme, partial [bacterium]|nr:PEP-utilizing enzyme [bacterium]
YKGLFKMKGRLTCLHSDFFVSGSLGLGDPVVVCKENDWRSFISLEGEKKCLQKGLEIFSSEALYSKYNTEFRDYIRAAKEKIIPRFSNNRAELSKEDLLATLPILEKFWYFYGITEFSYHELAYEKSLELNDATLKKNLDDLGKLKFEGRELLNAFVYNDGVLHNLLRIVGDRFLTQKEDSVFLFSDEILGLYDGKKIDQEILNTRKKYYGCEVSGGVKKIFSGSEASEAWNILCNEKIEDGVIKGTIANRGIVSGRVIIAPMLVDMKEIMKIDSRMKIGDILVAESTTPELMMLCKKAAAIVTDQGGMLSHAAIVSRELNIPGVIGTKQATHILKDGDLVEVDANQGTIKIIKRSV